MDIITQTETLYDLVDERDHAVISDALNPALSDCGVPVESSTCVRHCDGVVSFVCRMNTAARGVRYVPAPIKLGFERTRASVNYSLDAFYQPTRPFLPRDAVPARYMLSVCPSVRPSHAGIVSKRRNLGSRKQRHTIARG